MEIKKVLTTEEAADLLRITPTTLRRMVKQGKIPHMRITPKTMRFDRDVLLGMLNAEEQSK